MEPTFVVGIVALISGFVTGYTARSHDWLSEILDGLWLAVAIILTSGVAMVVFFPWFPVATLIPFSVGVLAGVFVTGGL